MLANAPIPGLTEALGDLQEANAGVATAAEEMNAGLGEEDTPADYDASEEGVEAARADAQEAFDGVVEDRDDLVEQTAGTNELSDAGKEGVTKYLGDNIALTEANLTTAQEGVQAEVDADETVLFQDDSEVASVVTDTTLRDFSEEQTFDLGTEEDKDQLLDLTNAATASGNITVDLATLSEGNKDSNGGGGQDTIILPDFADIAGTVNIHNMNLGEGEGADSLVAAGLAEASSLSIDVNAADGEGNDQGIFPYINVGVGGADYANSTVQFNNLINAQTFIANLAEQGLIKVENDASEDVTATVADGIGGFEGGAYDGFTISEVNGEALETGSDISIAGNAESLFSSVDRSDTEAGPQVETGTGWESLAENLGADGFAAFLENAGNLIGEDDVDSNLESVGVTLADLQQQMQDADAELTSARDANSDADLLDTVRTEINDYLGAGGDDVNADGEMGNDLLDLRTAIAGELDKDEVSLSAANVDSDALLNVLAGQSYDAELTDGSVVVEDSEAPTSFDGQGEWVQGDAVDPEADTVEYEWSYQPTAEEQSLLNALSAVEDRSDLVDTKEQTETNFESATTGEDDVQLGAQLGAIEDRLDALDSAEQDVVDAQAELDDANGLIDGLESALADQDAAEQSFTDQDLALPETLDADQSATDANDIFLFAEDEGNGVSVSGFGEEGQDTLFFGEGYTVTELGADQAITDRVGNVDTLEIFAQQDGDDMQLFVESDAAAGFDRGDIATEQMTQVTLENVSADNIDSFDGQTLVAGVAAEQTVEVA